MSSPRYEELTAVALIAVYSWFVWAGRKMMG